MVGPFFIVVDGNINVQHKWQKTNLIFLKNLFFF